MKKYFIISLVIFGHDYVLADNPVILIDKVKETRKFETFSKYNLEDILRTIIESKKIEDGNKYDIDIVAWAVKTDYLDIPPRIFEEAVVMVKPDGKPKKYWVLAYLGRIVNSTSSAYRRWSLSRTAPPLISCKVYKKHPADSEISEFIHSTNFGYNEFHTNRNIVSVVLYYNSREIKHELEKSIDINEKEKRMNEFIMFNSCHFPYFPQESD